MDFRWSSQRINSPIIPTVVKVFHWWWHPVPKSNTYDGLCSLLGQQPSVGCRNESTLLKSIKYSDLPFCFFFSLYPSPYHQLLTLLSLAMFKVVSPFTLFTSSSSLHSWHSLSMKNTYRISHQPLMISSSSLHLQNHNL